MKSSYLAKFDWIILKPLWFLFVLIAIYYFIYTEWIMGILMIIIDFLIGLVASSLHRNVSTAKLFVGEPKISFLFERENEELKFEESNKIAQATFKLGIVIGIASLILLIHHKIIWYFSVLISIGIGWLSLTLIGLIFGLFAGFMYNKK